MCPERESVMASSIGDGAAVSVGEGDAVGTGSTDLLQQLNASRREVLQAFTLLIPLPHPKSQIRINP